jgi:hypothetical protein
MIDWEVLSKALMKPSLQPVTMESSSKAMQQLDPLFCLPVVPVKTERYSDKSQILTTP